MKAMHMILGAVLVAGCAGAGSTGDSARGDIQYRRESERIEAMEWFQEFRRKCARSGGAVYVTRHTGGRLAPIPTVDELKTASCGARPTRRLELSDLSTVRKR